MAEKKLIDPKVFEGQITGICKAMEESIIEDMKINGDTELPIIDDLVLPQTDLAKAGVDAKLWYEYKVKEFVLTDDNKLNVNIERLVGGIDPKDEFAIEFRKFPVDTVMILYKTIYHSFYK